MRILVHGRFHPGIGGIETVVNLLAHEWTAAGIRVVVVSNSSYDRYHRRDFPFAVFYRPGPLRWLRLVGWADLVLHMNLSLKALWPHFLLRRPILISHASSYREIGPIRPIGLMNWRRGLKLSLMRRATNIAVSRAIADSIAIPCKIIPNPYDSKRFDSRETVPRDRELIFVGRLVSEKGVDLLIQAFKQLEPHWPAIHLTIVGDGPERGRLATQAARLGLGERIHFRGALAQREVARELRTGRAFDLRRTFWRGRIGRRSLWLRCGWVRRRRSAGRDRSHREDLSARRRQSPDLPIAAAAGTGPPNLCGPRHCCCSS